MWAEEITCHVLHFVDKENSGNSLGTGVFIKCKDIKQWDCQLITNELL